MSSGAKLRRIPGGFVHWCPGCDEVHQYQVPRWTFNGDLARPSFTPSMLLRTGAFVPGYENDPRFKGQGTRCHYVVTDGRIQFCADSTHALSGQTVDLPDWPYAPGDYGGIIED